MLDFEEFVDRLRMEHFALLGHSDGGAVALAYALKHPDRVEKLVLEDIGASAAGRPHGINARAELAPLPLTFARWEDAAAYQRRRNPQLSEQRLKDSLPYVFRQLADGSITWKYDLAGLLRFLGTASNDDFDAWQEIGRLTCPILLMRGARSTGVSDASVFAMREAKPDLECVDIADAGHNVHLDNAPAFNRELLEFLTRPSP